LSPFVITGNVSVEGGENAHSGINFCTTKMYIFDKYNPFSKLYLWAGFLQPFKLFETSCLPRIGDVSRWHHIRNVGDTRTAWCIIFTDLQHKIQIRRLNTLVILSKWEWTARSTAIAMNRQVGVLQSKVDSRAANKRGRHLQRL